MIVWYDPDGEEISMEEAAQLIGAKHLNASFKIADGRLIVARTTTSGGHWISTVWLGLDHGWREPDSEVLIFETMCFCHDHECELDNETWRYPTVDAARAGHDQAVAYVKQHEHSLVEQPE